MRKNPDYGGLSFDVAKLMGLNRARAVADSQRLLSGEPSQYGLVPDDLRCDAEQVEIDYHGIIRKSPK